MKERENINIQAEPDKPPKNKKDRLGRALWYTGFFLLNGLIIFFTARAEFSKKTMIPSGLLKGGGFIFASLAVACVGVVIASETFKYLLMMKRLGEKVSVRDAFETVALGKYFDSITPSGAGGQPFQIWQLRSCGYSEGASSAMPLAAFTTMQYSFVLLALAAFIFNSKVIESGGIKAVAYVGLAAYAAVPTLIVISAVSPRASAAIVNFFIRAGAKLHLVKRPEEAAEKSGAALKKYSDSLKYIAKSRILLVELFLLSMLYHLALCSLPYFVIRLFGGDIGLVQSICMCFFVYASVTVIPTPGNSGAAEGSFYLLFSQLDTDGLFWAMLVWRFLCYYSFILIGLLIYGVRGVKKIFKKE